MSGQVRKLSVTFTEEEFARLKEAKEKTGLSWHDFILGLLEEKKRISDFGADLRERVSQLRSWGRSGTPEAQQEGLEKVHDEIQNRFENPFSSWV